MLHDIERSKNRDAQAMYHRLWEKGRMAPQGLAYLESWVETNFDRCFQLMECAEQRWRDKWAATSGIWSSLSFFRCGV
jgi:hypothetical protein